MPVIEVSGAILVPLQSQGLRLNETIGGTAYTGQRYELSLFPQRNGRISVPSVTVDIEISKWGVQFHKQVMQGVTPPVHFIVEFPPGSENVSGLISTVQLTADQKWEPDISQIPVGGAIQRTIQLKAEDISSMAFAPVVFSGSDTVDVYAKTPIVEDQYSRGILTGRRTERVTYVFKKAGIAELPAVVVTWWDLKNEELRETVLPARGIEIALNKAIDDEGTAKGVSNKMQWILVGIVLIGLLSLIWFFRKGLHMHWDAWRQIQNESEKAYFQRFIKACRSGNPVNTLNALMQWLDHTYSHSGTARLDQFLEAYADSHAEKEADKLVRAVDSKILSPWNGSALINFISKAREKWRAQQRRRRTADLGLPLLNPRNKF
jgi:hypothetical protein